MNLNSEKLLSLSEKYGESFYILDLEQLTSNYIELLTAFRRRYRDSNIAYSYKTNYIPALCRQIDKLGGYAEVVSKMEFELAKQIGVNHERIILNGPVKSYATVEELLFSGGLINIDSENEINMLEKICSTNPKRKLRVGIRCNFDVADYKISRFGIDIDSQEFERVFNYIKNNEFLKLSGLHCHFAERGIDIWKNKVSGMLNLINMINLKDIEFVDFGGGLYGKMSESLKEQFSSPIPEFEEYAEAIAAPFAEFYKDSVTPPKLIIEPGSALVGDVMSFVSRVVSIKTVRNKPFATLTGSMYNINPTLSKNNLPISIYKVKLDTRKTYTNLDFCGYTCIESDYLYRRYTGELEVGDFVVFDNAGSYSVVLKPPFILPNFPIICIDEESGSDRLIKRGEGFGDIFGSYSFE